MSKTIRIEAVELLTESEAAVYIGMSSSFLNADRSNGPRKSRTKGPIFIKLGRSVRYLKQDLDMWLEQNRVIRK